MARKAPKSEYSHVICVFDATVFRLVEEARIRKTESPRVAPSIIYGNFVLNKRHRKRTTPSPLPNEMMHASVLGLLLTTGLLLVSATPDTQNENNNPDCFRILADGGATERFSGNVAHSIHSMTVEVLRTFERNATIDNIVPTVDMELSSDWPIRRNAPHAEPSPFVSDGMQTIDRVLGHMDKKNYDVKHFTILERIVHAFHMQEVWRLARTHYDSIKSVPPSPAVCRCARDVDNNGVMKALRFSALAMREPALVYGTSAKSAYYVQYSVTYNFYAANKFDAKAPLKPDSVLLKESDSMPALTDEASWSQWKKVLLSMDPSSHRDLALYLYCALHA